MAGSPRLEEMLPKLVVSSPVPTPVPLGAPEAVPLGTLFTTVMVIAAGSVASEASENNRMEMGFFMRVDGVFD